MSLAQFLLPGESVLYESPGEVYYRRKPFALYVTGERLVLHAEAGRFGGAERAVAEPLAAVVFLEYEEGGALRRSGRLHVRSAEQTLTLKGEPETIREVWQALQRHTFRTAADEEATLVAPPPPLFEDEPQRPAQVEPLATARRRAFVRRPARTALVVFIVCAAALAALVAAVLLGRRAAQTAARVQVQPAPAATPAPSPAPTPVALPVMDRIFELAEGSHLSVRFNVPPERAAARLSGGFRVTTGGHVDFYVMRPEQYERFAHGGEPEVTSVVYREEQSNARVGESLPAGDYYLVFDNYAADDTQTVAAEFFLILEEQRP